MRDGDRRGDERDDILGILRRYRPWYFLLLVLQIVGWGAVVICAGNTECSFHGQAVRLKTMGQDMSVLVPLWLLMSIILVDLGGNLVVLLPNYRKRLEDKAKAKGMAEGLSEGKARGIAEGKARGIAEGKAQERERSNVKLRAIAKKYGIPESELGIDDED